jgi:hypothetical protein
MNAEQAPRKGACFVSRETFPRYDQWNRPGPGTDCDHPGQAGGTGLKGSLFGYVSTLLPIFCQNTLATSLFLLFLAHKQ